VVQVGSGVVKSVSADEIVERITETAARQMVYGSQAKKAADGRQPQPHLVALASGASTCGYDKQWAQALKYPAPENE